MPNAFAFMMLGVWPLVVIAMFRRMPLERALIWSVLGGYLILPPVVVIDLPALPALDKHTIPSLAAAMCLTVMGRRVRILPATMLGKILVLMILFSPIGTVLTNREPVLFTVGGLPGLTPWDIVSSGAYQFMMLLPFLLARDVLAGPTAQKEIVRALLIGGLIYSIPMLYEVRMSPQLNLKIYGFFQHGFDQTFRFGGFRPIVFLQHGLWVAFFAVTALAAAVAALRAADPQNRMRYLVATIYLAIVLIFCRSLGPLVLAVAIVPLVFLASRRTQLRVAALLAVLVIAYPVLRGANLVPVEAMLEQAARIDEQRMQSLQFRFDNEEALLERAKEKPYFGWGAWNRNMIHDDATGFPVSISDGLWIIVIGIGGWFAFIAQFGLLASPLLMLRRKMRSLPDIAETPYLGALALMLAFNMIDLIPNATLTPLTWLLTGALLGYAEKLARVPARQITRQPQMTSRPA